ncbi:MAG: DUF1049 domain-containing protein [Clostridia bacterium]|nr:DUF1049 domain-containing protein [Clostridia bacterium]
MVYFVLVLSLLFALIVAIFAVQNNTPVDIAFLGWKYSGISLVLVIIGSATAGAVIIFFIGLFRQIKLTVELRQLKAANERLTKMLEDFKSKETETQEELNKTENTEKVQE